MIKDSFHSLNSYYRVSVIFVIAFLVFCHFSLKPSGVDAGLHMYGSLLVNKGLLPYKNLWNNKPPLIYVLGSIGFLFKPSPFIGVRALELCAFAINLFLIRRIVNIIGIQQSSIYLFCFTIIYLCCWDGGFLTETFTIPINLIAVYLFLVRSRYFEFLVSLCWILCFLLKQNAMFVVSAMILIDIFSRYRQAKTRRKLFFYAISFSVYIAGTLMLLKEFGIWEDFLDQVFIYNSEYVNHPSLTKAVINHLIRNNFVSIKGLSFLLIFNACMLITLWRYWKNFHSFRALNLKEKVFISSILVYLASYPFVYISGRTDAHYFILLIVPVTIMAGYYVSETKVGKPIMLLLLVYVLVNNINSIRFEKGVYAEMEDAADYMRSNSRTDDFILVAGFGNQYLHIISERLSPTKFVMPLREKNGYTIEYEKILSSELSIHPPLFIVLNKNNYRSLNPNDFYTQLVNKKLKKYFLVFENHRYSVYKKNSRDLSSIK